MSDLKALMQHIPQRGKLEWIGIRPAKKAELNEVEAASINVNEGLLGDHYSGQSGKRHVTLIQREHLDVVASILGQSKVDPGLLRRNLVVSGINLLSLLDQKVKIGEHVELEITGRCHPCSRMEENLGSGGYSAMRGHGGVTARVINGGEIQLQDSVIHSK
jgi:MOSC domain-containing protein YiiM